MPQATTSFTTRTPLPTSDAFWNLIKVPVAVSLLKAWNGERVKRPFLKATLRKQVREADITIELERIARWLKAHSPEPSMTPPEGVNGQEWAVDRAFYINCRTEQIKVDRLLQNDEFGLQAYMTPRNAQGGRSIANPEKTRRRAAAAGTVNAVGNRHGESSSRGATGSDPSDAESTDTSTARARNSPAEPAPGAPREPLSASIGRSHARHSSRAQNASDASIPATSAFSSPLTQADSPATQSGKHGSRETSSRLPSLELLGAPAPTGTPPPGALPPANPTIEPQARTKTADGTSSGILNSSNARGMSGTMPAHSSTSSFEPEATNTTQSVHTTSELAGTSPPGSQNSHATTSDSGLAQQPPGQDMAPTATTATTSANAGSCTAEIAGASQTKLQKTRAVSSGSRPAQQPPTHQQEAGASMDTTSANARSTADLVESVGEIPRATSPESGAAQQPPGHLPAAGVLSSTAPATAARATTEGPCATERGAQNLRAICSSTRTSSDIANHSPTGAAMSSGSGPSQHPPGHQKEVVANAVTMSATAAPSAADVTGASQPRPTNPRAASSSSGPTQKPPMQQQAAGASTAATSANAAHSTEDLVEYAGFESVGERSRELSRKQDVIPWPVPEQYQDEFANRLLQVLEAYDFVNDEGLLPNFERETIHNCGELSGEVPIALRGRDPRPTEDWPKGKPFMHMTSAVVHYTPHDQMIFLPSSRVLESISHDPTFYKGAFVVQAPDGTGHYYTCGCFDGTLITKTPELRIPLLMTKSTSVLAWSHHIPLALSVDLETTIPVRKEPQPPNEPNRSHEGRDAEDEEEPEEDEEEPGVDEEESANPNGGWRSQSPRPTKKSKGKERASLTARRAKRQPTRQNKEPRVPRNQKEAWLVNYIANQEGPKGIPWKDTELVESVHHVADRITLTGKTLLEAADMVSLMTKLTVDDATAPYKLPGKEVTNMAVAVFLNVNDNWITDMKEIKWLKDVHKDQCEVKKYLKVLDNFRTSPKAVIKNLKECINQSMRSSPAHTKARAHTGAGHRPKKKQRLNDPDDENAAGPSTQRHAHRGFGDEEDDDEEDDRW